MIPFWEKLVNFTNNEVVEIEDFLRVLYIMLCDIGESHCPITGHRLISDDEKTYLHQELEYCLQSSPTDLNRCCEVATKIKKLECKQCNVCKLK